MTTCVPIKLGGVSTRSLVMRVMCWQPGKTGVFKKTENLHSGFQRGFPELGLKSISIRMSGFRESRLPPVTKPLIKVQKAGFF